MKLYKYLFLGAISAFMIHNFTSCKKNESNPVEQYPSNPTEKEVILDLEDDAKKTESAFKSGSITEVKKVISESAISIYGNDLENVKPKFNSFAEALKNKKLISYSELYAEYQITIEGKSYFVSFAKQTENGDWKLIRF